MTSRATACASGLAIVIACVVLARAAQAPPAPALWMAFEGTWSASGQRHTIAIEASKAAVAVDLAGPVVLSRTDGLSRGFRGAAIGFDDGEGLTVGRCVWVDEHGDQLFSRLTGESVGTGRRIVGTITGGTGRYEGAIGEYAFTWEFVVQTEDRAIHGRSVGLSGRVRRGGPQR